MRARVLLGALIAWFGYAAGWYGFTFLKGNGAPGGGVNLGFTDLIVPSRAAATKQALVALLANGPGGQMAPAPTDNQGGPVPGVPAFNPAPFVPPGGASGGSLPALTAPSIPSAASQSTQGTTQVGVNAPWWVL